jgi:hypothetical protein
MELLLFYLIYDIPSSILTGLAEVFASVVFAVFVYIISPQAH